MSNVKLIEYCNLFATNQYCLGAPAPPLSGQEGGAVEVEGGGGLGWEWTRVEVRVRIGDWAEGVVARLAVTKRFNTH